MRPLESHLQMTSHVMMYNRIRELLIREGLLSTDAATGDLREALGRWVTMVEQATEKHRVVSH